MTYAIYFPSRQNFLQHSVSRKTLNLRQTEKKIYMYNEQLKDNQFNVINF